MFVISIKDPDKGTGKAKLVPGIYRIGCSPAAHIQIERPEVSARHCQLIVSENSMKIQDLGSSNGTFLDGQKLPQDPLEAPVGSTIKVGAVEIFVEGPDTPPVPAGQLPADAGQAKLAHSVLVDQEKKKELTSQIKKAEETAKRPGVAVKELPILKISGIPLETRPLVQEIKKRAHFELLKRLNLKH